MKIVTATKIFIFLEMSETWERNRIKWSTLHTLFENDIGFTVQSYLYIHRLITPPTPGPSFGFHSAAKGVFSFSFFHLVIGGDDRIIGGSLEDNRHTKEKTRGGNKVKQKKRNVS